MQFISFVRDSTLCRTRHWQKPPTPNADAHCFSEWMIVCQYECWRSPFRLFPTPTLSHSFSFRLTHATQRTAAGPPTLNSHCFSFCRPTALLHRRYRQLLPVARRRRAKPHSIERTQTGVRERWRGFCSCAGFCTRPSKLVRKRKTSTAKHEQHSVLKKTKPITNISLFYLMSLRFELGGEAISSPK